MKVDSAVAETTTSRVRYLIVFMLFFVTTISYADRATLW